MESKNRLVGLIGVVATALVIAIVPQFEGTVLKGYRDPIGVVTACAGHTKTAVLGRTYTKEECQTLLFQDLFDHAQPVLGCTPVLHDKPYQLAAAISLAYNIGTTAYCNSTVARRFNAGDMAGACAAFDMWVYAGGQVLPGLVTRRKAERALCEGKH